MPSWTSISQNTSTTTAASATTIISNVMKAHSTPVKQLAAFDHPSSLHAFRRASILRVPPPPLPRSHLNDTYKLNSKALKTATLSHQRLWRKKTHVKAWMLYLMPNCRTDKNYHHTVNRSISPACRENSHNVVDESWIHELNLLNHKPTDESSRKMQRRVRKPVSPATLPLSPCRCCIEESGDVEYGITSTHVRVFPSRCPNRGKS